MEDIKESVVSEENNLKEFEKKSTDTYDKKEPIISLRNVDITFGTGKKAFKAVENVSFDIY